MGLLPPAKVFRAWRLLEMVWIAVCLGLLILMLSLRQGASKTFEDASQMGFYLMAALSWPSSLLIVWGGRLFHLHLEGWTYTSASTSRVIAVWLCFFVVGCLQWLVLPWMLRRRWASLADTGDAVEPGRGTAHMENPSPVVDHGPETGTSQSTQIQM